MVATNGPFGFLPIRHMGGGSTRPESIANAINSGYGTSLSTGQPVILTTSGVLNAVTAVGDEVYAIFAGVNYVDGNGNPQNLPNWPANATGTEIVVSLWMDPMIVYKVQANGSVAATGRGACADATSFGSAANGFSQMAVSNNLSTAGQFRIIDKYLGPDNDFGDAYTVLQVTIAKSQIIAQKSGV